MSPRGTFRSEKTSGSFKKGETLRFADYTGYLFSPADV